MIRRHDATLDEALDLRRSNPIPRARAVIWITCALVLLIGYGIYGYVDKQERTGGKKPGKKPPNAPPPASAPAGR